MYILPSFQEAGFAHWNSDVSFLLSIFSSVCLPNCISLSPCPTFPYFPFFFLFFFFFLFLFFFFFFFPLLYYSSSFSFFPFFLHLPFLFSKISKVPPDLPSSGATRALLQTVRALVICNVLSLLTSAKNTPRLSYRAPGLVSSDLTFFFCL